MRGVLGLFLVLSAALATAGDAATPRIAGRILFASEEGSTLDNTELYAIRSDGSGRRALSRNTGGGDRGAAWSPNGALIAYWSERVERGRRISGLFVMRADGTGRRRLTPANLAVDGLDLPSWSPDGQRLAFSAERGGRRGLWVIRANGTGLRALTRTGGGAAWSPRGDRIAFLDIGGIRVVPARGGASRRLTRGPSDGAPSWSPDGRTIAFVRSDVNGLMQALYLVPGAGGRARRIYGGTRRVTMGRDPQWSPDGRRIALEASGFVYVVRVRGRAARRLRPGDWPSWSPDGRRIAFTRGSSVYVMNADGTRVRRVRTERGYEFSDGPVWSPDGRTLVYGALLAKSDLDIFVVNTDGSQRRQLTHNSIDDRGPAWSPNRRRIAFVRRGAIWLMAADGTKQDRLVPGGQPSWAPNGLRLAFSQAGAIYMIGASGGSATRLVAGGSPAWSPSGTEIAFVRGPRLLVLDLRTGTEHALVDISSTCPGTTYEASLYGPDWAPDGRRLVYAVACDDGRFVSMSPEVVGADGGGRTALPLGELQSSRLAWSPDGTRVVFVPDHEVRRIGTARLDGTGRTTVVRGTGGAAYIDPDW
jgi:Tol biopolymer transport system component